MWRYLLLLVGIIFFVWTAATSLTQVQPNQRAVVRRFGRILDDKPQPGLHVGWPWGIDRVELVDIGVRSVSIGYTGKEERDADDEAIPAGQMLTGDHNLVNVQVAIDYRVGGAPRDLDNYILQRSQINSFVARAAESLLAEWLAGRKVDDVLLKGKVELPQYLRTELPKRLEAYEIGIDVERATISRLDPPDQVKKDFERLGQAETTKKTRINQADQEANRKRDEAKSEVYRIEKLAQAYQNEERTRAKADAESFERRLAQYREFTAKNPDYLNAMWLDEMTRLYTRMREGGRIELLDHFLTSEGLTITQFPLSPRKK